MKDLHRLTSFAMAASLAAALAGSASLVFDKIITDALDGWTDGHRFQLLAAMLSTVVAAGSLFAAVEISRRNRLRRRARRVFIIYSHKDRDKAAAVAKLLRQSGVEPWLDFENIVAGEVWRDVVRQALDDSAMAVVLFTENSFASESVKGELEQAIKTLESRDRITSPIIPLLYMGGEVPDRLKHIHYVDMSQEDANAFLVRSVERAMDRVLQSLDKQEASRSSKSVD